jgi:phospholipid/cholesterol/gamma-HCH transport system substrate-binding protein
MAVEKNYARLGFFLVVVLTLLLATALLFIQRLRSREVLELVTYTIEDVSGLDVSSPVRYRGVSVGRVTDIRVDPRAEPVEIDFEVFLDRLNTVGFSAERIRKIVDLRGTFPKLRAQVIGNLVTGEAYLLLDVPQNPPPPISLGFTPTRPYIPSVPRPLAAMQDRLPAVLERAEATLRTLREIVYKLPDSLERSNRFFTNIERIFQESQLPALSADSRQFFATTSRQIEQLTSELDKLVDTGGSLVQLLNDAQASMDASKLPATTQTARDALNQTNLAAEELRRSLPVIRDSLAEFRELARMLAEQPESVVYGRRPAREKR